jgi:DNA-binding FadR family transcriptional regulator
MWKTIDRAVAHGTLERNRPAGGWDGAMAATNRHVNELSSAAPPLSTTPPPREGPPRERPPRLPRGLPRAARRTGLIHRVIEQLRDQVVTGAWPIGSRIPTEAELVRLTATSRNTVREAVGSLVHAGVLERRQGSGTYVLAASELAGAVGRRVRTARYRDVLEVRRALEVGAAQLAAVRRTPDDLATMRACLRARGQACAHGDPESVVRHDVALHRAIAEAAHNPVLAELYDNLVGALVANMRYTFERWPPADDTDHLALVMAIEDGDPHRAAGEATCLLDDLLTVASG